MTNGEKFKEIFQATEGQYTWERGKSRNDLIIPISVGDIRMCFLAKWWNAEYKESKEIHLIPIGDKPSDITITISKGAVKHGNKDYVVYKRDWLMDHLDSEFEVLKGARELGEKIKNAKPSTWLTDGLTQEEVAKIVTQSKNGAIRECMNCKHYRMTKIDGKTYGACESWECKFEQKER